MPENEKGEAESKKRHFFKLHQKIHNKYEEMQRKMAKSKSVDALSNLSEGFNYTQEKYCSAYDLRESNYPGSDRQSLTPSVNNEGITTKSAKCQNILREARISELVDDYMIIERDDIINSETYFDKKLSTMISFESLNDAGVDSDGAFALSTPSKVSIRNKISSRLSAAKEKRKEVKREKEQLKEKKKEARDKVEKFILSNTTKQDLKFYNKRTKAATVTIALIEATGLETDISEDKDRFMFCRFRLGADKYKSKLIKVQETVVKWQELFNLNLFDEHMLEITLWDKDFFIGRSIVDLVELEKQKTHRLRINLECDVGKAELFILLTMSGTSLHNTLVDLEDYEETKRRLSRIKKDYAWYNGKNETGDVGCLSIIVYGAKGLISHENYCILQLGNERLQTHTESKTTDPNWMKIFTFPVNDITSILVITVHDEKKSEDVGKVSIPLLDIRNGDKKWYALKDPTQRERAKGNNPRILLEMRVAWNVLRASIRVINPKEVNYLEMEEKLQRHIFARNLSRAKAVMNWILNAFRVVKTLFEWESRKLNFIALVLWLLFCWSFKIWMLPLLFLVPFLWYRPEKYVFINWKEYVNEELALEIYNDPKKEKEEKTTWRQKLNSLSDMVQTVQNVIGQCANIGESIKNLFNFTVPFLSCLAIFMISAVALVMYLIPANYIFMIWGIHKFTRKILRPNRVPNNEILDLLSRVPDDETLLNIQQFPLEELPQEDMIQ